MIVTFENDGESKISNYDDKSNLEIINLLHTSSIREQMVSKFNKLCNPLTSSDNSIGYALEIINGMSFCSKISQIEFHPNKTLKNFNITKT